MGRLHEHKSSPRSRAHIYLCLTGPMHCANIYGVRLILREFNCCAHGSRCRWHLLKTSSHSLPLSLALCSLPRCVVPSLPPSTFFFSSLPSPSFFFLSASTRWRDAPLQTSLAQVHNAPSHVIWPAISSLSISFLFVSVYPEVFPLSQCPSPPPDKGRQRPFISP